MVTTIRFTALKTLSVVVPVVTVIAVGSYAIVRYRKIASMSRKAALAADLLKNSDVLAEDCVETDEAVKTAWYEDHLQLVSPQGVFQDEIEVVEQPKVAVPACSTVKYDSEDRKVSEHLVVRQRKRYMQSVIAEAKTRFGKPDRTSANVLAVRKLWVTLCASTGSVPPILHACYQLWSSACLWSRNQSERHANWLKQSRR
nr:hypothetical protein [Tolivirales sp.]